MAERRESTPGPGVAPAVHPGRGTDTHGRLVPWIPADNVTEFHCRGCEHAPVMPVLSLGRTPLANALLSESQLAEPEETFPLDLVFCEQCALVQITETVPAD